MATLKRKPRKWSLEYVLQVKTLSGDYLPNQIARIIGLSPDEIRAIQDYKGNGIPNPKRRYGFKKSKLSVEEGFFDYKKMGNPF